jgi:hypothetical protein
VFGSGGCIGSWVFYYRRRQNIAQSQIIPRDTTYQRYSRWVPDRMVKTVGRVAYRSDFVAK